MSKELITNADDFGYRRDISRAIITAHTGGILTSTTVLINFVSSEDMLLVKDVPQLGFGLYLNITSGEPLTQNWKNKYGDFSRPFRNEQKQFDQDVWLNFFAQFDPDDVFAEYEAQLKKFQQLFGHMPKHLDSHHYASVYEATFPAYAKLAQKYHLPVRLPKIWAPKDEQHPMGNIIDAPEREVILKAAEIKTTTYFSLKYLCRYDDYVSELKKELEKVSEGESIEISFHPGTEEEWRSKELKILTDPRVKQTVDEMGFTLVTFADVK